MSTPLFPPSLMCHSTRAFDFFFFSCFDWGRKHFHTIVLCLGWHEMIFHQSLSWARRGMLMSWKLPKFKKGSQIRLYNTGRRYVSYGFYNKHVTQKAQEQIPCTQHLQYDKYKFINIYLIAHWCISSLDCSDIPLCLCLHEDNVGIN